MAARQVCTGRHRDQVGQSGRLCCAGVADLVLRGALCGDVAMPITDPSDIGAIIADRLIGEIDAGTARVFSRDLFAGR